VTRTKSVLPVPLAVVVLPLHQSSEIVFSYYPLTYFPMPIDVIMRTCVDVSDDADLVLTMVVGVPELVVVDYYYR
jgi:hypothetical protein